jgi:hypothetical protein
VPAAPFSLQEEKKALALAATPRSLQTTASENKAKSRQEKVVKGRRTLS